MSYLRRYLFFMYMVSLREHVYDWRYILAFDIEFDIKSSYDMLKKFLCVLYVNTLYYNILNYEMRIITRVLH